MRDRSRDRYPPHRETCEKCASYRRPQRGKRTFSQSPGAPAPKLSHFLAGGSINEMPRLAHFRRGFWAQMVIAPHTDA